MRFRAIILLSCILYIVSLVIVIRDNNFENRWIAFFYWIASILVYLSLFIVPKVQEWAKKIIEKFRNIKVTRESVKKIVTKSQLLSLFIVALIFLVSLFAINVYPFHSVGDEMRDGALNAAQIVNGEIKNIFAYGRYESHGLIIPEYSALFYLFMGNNPLMHRFAAVTIGILSCILLYFWIKKYFSQMHAVFSTLILLFMPLYLYYSRTEVVVIFSCFWMVIILWLVTLYFNNPTSKMLGLLAVTLGFAAGFHGSTRTIVLLTILLAAFWTFIKFVPQKKLYKLLIFFIIAASMFAVGFGPRVYFTDTKNAVMQSRFFFSQESNEVPLLTEKATDWEKATYYAKRVESSAEKLYINYVRSFFVYFYEPTTTHFDCDSILGAFIGLFFIYGLFEMCTNPKRPRWVVIYFTLLIPLTNSALTEVINGDHRLAPAFAIAAIVAGFGIEQLYLKLSELRYPRLKIVAQMGLLAFVLGNILLRGVFFFVSQQASYGMFLVDGGKLYQDFMVTYTMKEVQQTRMDRYGKLCIYANESNFKYLEKYHIKEQFAYFLPRVKIELEKVKDLPDHEWYVDNTCAYAETLQLARKSNYQDLRNPQLWEKKNYCQGNEMFICPPDKSSFTINYRTDLEAK